MPLQRYSNKSPSRLFDKALNSAYERHYRFGASNQKNEPGFVRELISTVTINHLNIASSRVYDATINNVFFRGGYLHARPYASFTARVPSGLKQCRRELADALIIVYVTAPSTPGAPPRVIRRAACMVMFKRESTSPPRTPSYKPIVDPLPLADPNKKFTGDSDKEQFYLFSQWPEFTLETGRLTNRVQLGTFKLTASHDIGKFGLVWNGAPMAKWKIDNKPKAWLFSDPVPSQIIGLKGNQSTSGSLGFLLEEMIDSNAGSGRNFTVCMPRVKQGDWDDLMSLLLGYPAAVSGAATWDPGLLQQQGNYYGASRNINPAVLQFTPNFGRQLELESLISANFFGTARTALTPYKAMRRYQEVGPEIPEFFPVPWERVDIPFTLAPPDNEEDGYLPVLIATVHKHVPFGG